jgi:hypothetical protein
LQFSSEMLVLSLHERRGSFALPMSLATWRDVTVLKNAKMAVTACLAIAVCFTLVQGNAAMASSKSQRCEAYAHNAARATPTRGGPVRGAVVGAGIGSFSAAAGAGAAIGAGVGVTRRVVQRTRSYSYYYDRCMRR